MTRLTVLEYNTRRYIDKFRRCVPIVALHRKSEDGQWRHVGNTEPSAERVFPSFDKPFVINFDYQSDCEMKVSVYDAPDKVVGEVDRMGTAHFRLFALLQLGHGRESSLSLKHGRPEVLFTPSLAIIWRSSYQFPAPIMPHLKTK
jgi:hypothetical protein